LESTIRTSTALEQTVVDEAPQDAQRWHHRDESDNDSENPRGEGLVDALRDRRRRIGAPRCVASASSTSSKDT